MQTRGPKGEQSPLLSGGVQNNMTSPPSQVVHHHVPVSIQARLLPHHEWLRFGERICHVERTWLSASAVHAELDDGRQVSFPPDQLLSAVYPNAVRAQDLQDGMRVIGPWNLIGEVWQLQKTEEHVTFTLIGLSQPYGVTCLPDDYLEIP